MKLLLSIALTLVAANQAQAQCSFTFCGGFSNIPDKSVKIDATDPENSKTCGQLFTDAATPGIYNTLQCEESVKGLEVICCPAGATRTCHLCDDKGAYNAGRSIGIAQCQQVDSALALAQNDTHCTELKSTAPYNVQSFCECSGAEAPGTCKICGDDQQVNTTGSVPIAAIGTTLSCVDGAALAKHVTDETLWGR